MLFRSGNLRSDSPPNWIRDNLEQLTSEPRLAESGYQHSQHSSQALNHAFNGLGLGGGVQGGRRPMAGGWGGATATPPPGFSHHRPPLGQQYQGFKAAEGPKIGDFN